MPAHTIVSVVLATILALLLVGTVAARLRGNGVGGTTIARCSAGHLFTTIWLAGGSLKAIRLGWWRFQRCPVGNHWALVAPVKESSLTDAERESAAQHRDVRIP